MELSGTRDPGRQWSYMQIGVAGCTLVTRHRVPTSLITIIIIIIIKYSSEERGACDFTFIWKLVTASGVKAFDSDDRFG